MGQQTCYNDVVEIIEAGCKQFGSKYSLVQEKFDGLRQICTILDGLAAEFDCDILDIDVDDITKQLILSLECPDIVLDNGASHRMFDVISSSDGFSFSKPRKDTIRISFYFDRMWVSANG